jgi:hypothetical protein
MGQRETDFQNFFPTFSPTEAVIALGVEGEIVSFCGRSGAPDIFVMKLATRGRAIGPIGLNPVVARALLAALQKHVAALPPER